MAFDNDHLSPPLTHRSTKCNLPPLSPSFCLLGSAEQVFMAFDKDGNGRIDQDELREVFKTLGCEMTDEASFQEVMSMFLLCVFICFDAVCLYHSHVLVLLCSSSTPYYFASYLILMPYSFPLFSPQAWKQLVTSSGKIAGGSGKGGEITLTAFKQWFVASGRLFHPPYIPLFPLTIRPTPLYSHPPTFSTHNSSHPPHVCFHLLPCTLIRP